jgi:hypothetical protein
LLVYIFGSPVKLGLLVELIPLFHELSLPLLFLFLLLFESLKLFLGWLLGASALLRVLSWGRWLFSTSLDVGSGSLLCFLLFCQLSWEHFSVLETHSTDLKLVLVRLLRGVVFL